MERGLRLGEVRGSYSKYLKNTGGETLKDGRPSLSFFISLSLPDGGRSGTRTGWCGRHLDQVHLCVLHLTTQAEANSSIRLVVGQTA